MEEEAGATRGGTAMMLLSLRGVESGARHTEMRERLSVERDT